MPTAACGAASWHGAVIAFSETNVAESNRDPKSRRHAHCNRLRALCVAHPLRFQRGGSYVRAAT